MFKSVHVSVVVLVSMVLSGCATAPRYETIRRDHPPATREGQACVQRCEQVLASCQADCRAVWKACTARVEPMVDPQFAKALKAYAGELQRYNLELNRYQMDMWMDWNFRHGGGWYSPWPGGPWYDYGWAPVPPGNPPTRDAVRDRLYQAQCKDDCGCQGKYDACFTDCGGRIELETRQLGK